MTEKQKKERVEAIYGKLLQLYPDSHCSLEYGGDVFRLLVMARLSAQCTDERVNIVSKELFEKYPTVKKMAEAELADIENIIRPCGLFRTKAKSILEMSKMLIRDFGGKVPSDMDSLLSLPGVGRKIANLVRGDHFGLGGIVADTHCIRLSNRFGLVKSHDPAVVERTLDVIVPKNIQSDYCHRMVDHGRNYCRAQNPHCPECPLFPLGICKK